MNDIESFFRPTFQLHSPKYRARASKGRALGLGQLEDGHVVSQSVVQVLLGVEDHTVNLHSDKVKILLAVPPVGIPVAQPDLEVPRASDETPHLVSHGDHHVIVDKGPGRDVVPTLVEDEHGPGPLPGVGEGPGLAGVVVNPGVSLATQHAVVEVLGGDGVAVPADVPAAGSSGGREDLVVDWVTAEVGTPGTLPASAPLLHVNKDLRGKGSQPSHI